MTITDRRIPDAGLIWIRRGLNWIAIPDPNAGTLCHAPGCKRPRANQNTRYCSDACKTADTHPDIRTCHRCHTPITTPGAYCTPECKRATEAQRTRTRDWTLYSHRDKAGAHNHGTCPTCGATQGRKCRSANGNTIGRDHKNRPTP